MAVDSHTTLEVESLDRIFLKVIQMRLQDLGGVAWFFRKHQGEAFATAKVMAEMTRPFVTAIEKFAETNAIPLIGFDRDQRKDDLAKEYLAVFSRSRRHSVHRQGSGEGVRRPHNLPASRAVIPGNAWNCSGWAACQKPFDLWPPASPTRPYSKRFFSKSKRQLKETQWLLQIPKLDSSATSCKR